MSLQRRTIIVRAIGCVALAAFVLVLSAAQQGPQATMEPASAVTSVGFAQEASGRHRQLADDSARLLALAIALKAEVDKTSQNTLSLSVIRKADEIEKLAHTVREHMKVSGTGS